VDTSAAESLAQAMVLTEIAQVGSRACRWLRAVAHPRSKLSPAQWRCSRFYYVGSTLTACSWTSGRHVMSRARSGGHAIACLRKN